MKWIKKLFKKEEIKINDSDAIMNVWKGKDFSIAFLEESFHAHAKGMLYFGKYDLWRGLIRWQYSGEIPHDIFKQPVNYQFVDDKLLITWNDKSFEFHKKGK